MPIRRNATDALRRAAARAPAVALTGPRQSGKTTLCREVFSDRPYVSLEPLDHRAFASEDPRGFLASYRDGVVLDEVQRAPGLFSYLQEEVDRDPTPGRFILTGSQQFELTEAISQSLAGRIAHLRLLPLGLDELRRFPSPPTGLWDTLFAGAYPRIFDRGLEPSEWLDDYLATYVQRDVRQVLRVTDLGAFERFLRLAAARTGQELNLSSLGADVGVSYNTIRSWISVLEASFVVFLAQPWVSNLRKRVVKAPKLHFVDSGLACRLLGIHDSSQLRTHPLRGAVFESWVASEILKNRVHRGLSASLFHLRLARGPEIDLIVEAPHGLLAVEAKSGATVASDFLKHLRAFSADLKDRGHAEPELRLVYGGDERMRRSDVEVLSWDAVAELEW